MPYFHWSWLILPPVGALIGWLTNVVAVRSIFRPHAPVRFLGMTLHGLIPRRRADLAARVAETIEREFLSPEDIRRCLSDPGLLDGFKRQIEEKVNDFIRRKFDDMPALVLTFLPADLEHRLRDKAMEKIAAALPDIAERFAANAEEQFDIRRIVRERIDALPVHEMERIVIEIARRELRAIEVLGGVLGFLVGLAQIVVLWGWRALGA